MSGGQPAVQLGLDRFCGQESIAVKSPAAPVAGHAQAKTAFRQRNLNYQFDLDLSPVDQLDQLEAKAAKLGNYVLGGRLLREVDAVWSELSFGLITCGLSLSRPIANKAEHVC